MKFTLYKIKTVKFQSKKSNFSHADGSDLSILNREFIAPM